MKLLVVWHGALFPSYRKLFWQLQRDYGWDVHLLTARSWSKAMPRKTYHEVCDQEPIRVYPHPTLGGFHGATFFWPSFPFLFAKIKPDAVYVIEEPFSLMGWLTVYWCKRHVPKVPVMLYSFQDILKHFPAPFSWMEHYALTQCDRVLVSNKHVGEVIETKGGYRQWEVLPQPVDTTHFACSWPLDRKDFFTLGYVGRLADEKGLDTVLWALSYLDDSVRFRIYGDGPARFRLEKMAQELGVYEQVAFMGVIPHEKLSEIYTDLDALVLPSKTTPNWQEQFGRVLIESMSCGTPVIGSTCGAIPEVVGDAGMIFPEGNDKKLADIIAMLQNDPHAQQNLSLRGRSRVEQHYSLSVVANQLNGHLIEMVDHARCI